MSIRNGVGMLALVGINSLGVQAARATQVAQAAGGPLSEDTVHTLNKAHAILMVFGWLFFIPSAFLFARMARDSFQKSKPFGLAVWFHFHRTFNMIGIVLITCSLLCILISKNWAWSGIGSGKPVPVQVHTMAGLIAIFLAWCQPFVSLVRCGPADPKRVYFNWTHRMIGVVAFLLASLALALAATKFLKLWQNPTLQAILVLTPALLLFVLSNLSVAFNRKDDNHKETDYSLRLSLCFWGIGILMTIATVLTILIAQGYKS